MTEDNCKHEHRLSGENLDAAADLAGRKRLFLGAVRRGGKRAQRRFENGYRRLLLAPGGFAL